MESEVVILKNKEQQEILRDLIVRTTRGDLLYWAAIRKEDLDKLVARGFKIVKKGTYDDYVRMKQEMDS